MKQHLLLSFIFLQFICLGQKKSTPRTDFNTLYVCLDSVSYLNLFQNTYLKDTLSLCWEVEQETTTDSYSGKYLIGEASTIEFFQPKKNIQLGDNFGDFGIEFKTRKINMLSTILSKCNDLNYTIDTSTTIMLLDSLEINWYKTISFKNRTNELAILEYQKEYLENLGFTKEQMNKSMNFKQFNSVLSNGKKYPRQFEKVSYIKLYADKKIIDDLQKFAKLNNCKKKANTFSNGDITIEYEEVEKLPQFPIQEIAISLVNDQASRIEKISEHLSLKIEGKKARFIFKNVNE